MRILFVVYVEKIISVLFCASRRKKEPKNAVKRISRLQARPGLSECPGLPPVPY
jgi:hypothetical protein